MLHLAAKPPLSSNVSRTPEFIAAQPSNSHVKSQLVSVCICGPADPDIIGGSVYGNEKRTNTADEITVQRINIVEPDGTPRLIISNHAKLPGVMVHSKEKPLDRPQAGLIFLNDEGV